MIRSDGFYVCVLPGEDVCEWLRFYDDGHVTTAVLVETADILNVARWFGRDDKGSHHGRWSVEGDAVSFSTVGKGLDENHKPLRLEVQWQGRVERADLVLSMANVFVRRSDLRFVFRPMPTAAEIAAAQAKKKTKKKTTKKKKKKKKKAQR